jgi:RNA-binding protein 5/10
MNWLFLSLVQCNEPRTDDAPAADISLSNSTSLGKKGLEAG